MTRNQERRFNKPLIIGLICFVCAAAYVTFMFYAGQHKDDQKTTTATQASAPIRIGAFSTAIDYAPFLVAQSKGWIQEELGVPSNQIEFTTFQTLPSINEAFASGKLDVVVTSEVAAIIGRAAGIDLRITGLDATLTEGILVRSAAPIHVLKDLKGRRVAVLSGSAMDYGVVKLLSSVGINRNDVNLINMLPPDAAAAFASGQIDGWSVWPPWPEQQVIGKSGRFLPDAEVKVQSVVVMRQGFIDQGTSARAIMRAIARGKVWLAQHPSEGISFIAQQLQLPEDVVRLAWPKHDWSAQLSPDITSDMQDKASFLLSEKLIQHPVSVADMVEPLSPTE
jgi:sulfonate transport system substrate-binding protein